MAKHSHNHVETYDGLIGFGLDRETDENTVIYYLQKFSDDELMSTIIKKMSADELEEIFNMLVCLIKNHLTHKEYHTLFLKDNH